MQPAEAAIELLADAEKAEENISGAYQTILAQQLGIDLESQAASSQEGAVRAADEGDNKPKKRECPVCGVVNQGTAVHCQRCGYDFSMEQP